MRFIFFFLTCVSVFAQTISFDLLKEKKQLETLPTVTANVLYDPLYKQPKKYEGYRLDSIVKLMLRGTNLTKPYTLILKTEDGYDVSLEAADISSNAILAFKDSAAPEAQQWISFRKRQGALKPGPYYLVWSHTIYHNNQKFPYQVVALEITTDKRYPHARPESKDDSVQRGYVQYKNYCIKCHSMNLEGGTIGPELNVPRNVTEYFQNEALIGFIKDAQSYIANTTMPSHNFLSATQLYDIVAYLKAMKLQKRCSSKKQCNAVLESLK